MNCEQCGLNGCEKVLSAGPEQADLVIVGEAPGAQEVLEGIPFAARLEGRMNAGYVLWNCLGQVGIERENVFTTNVCLCRPPGNRTPTPKEVACCLPRLEREIAGRNPKFVLMLGNTALRALTKTRMGISEGRKYDWEVMGAVGLATYHPAAIIRQGDLFTDFASDLEDYVDRLNGKGRDRQSRKLLYKVISTLDELKAVVKQFKSPIAVDIETSGFDSKADYILCITVAWEDKAIVIDGELFDNPVAIAILDDALGKHRQVYHNCLHKKTHVTLADGSAKAICDLSVGEKVRSIDLHTGGSVIGTVSNKEISRPPRNGSQRWVKVTVDLHKNNRDAPVGVWSSPGHKFWVLGKGWVQASSLSTGDLLYFKGVLTPTQRSVALGTSLGDATIQLQEGAKVRAPHLRFTHSLKQEAYCRYKGLLLEASCTEITQSERSFTPNAMMIQGVTRSLPDLLDLYFRVYKNGEKKYSTEALQTLDDVSWAFWFMDDGGKSNSNGSTLTLALGNCTGEEAQEVKDRLASDFGVKVTIHSFNNPPRETLYYQLVISPGVRGGTNTFAARIAPYVHPVMRYKLPETLQKVPFIDLQERIRTELPEALPSLVREVTFPENIMPRSRGSLYYDIEVVPWGNFYADGVLVSNSKFDVPFLLELGLTNARVDEDTMLLSYVLDERKGIHGLKELSRKYLGVGDYEQELKQYLPTRKTSYAEIPKEVLFKYAAKDSHYTIEMFEILRPKVSGGLQNVYEQILLPGSRALIRVESRGLLIDREYMEQLGQRYQQEMAVLEKELQQWGGNTFNPRSPAQVEELLRKMALVPPDHKGANRAVLESLPHDFPRLLLKYRKVAKKYSTYIEGLAKTMHDDGRVYPSYLLHGTETGRLSTTKPAIHTIPRDPEIRNLFVASPGCKLVYADFNQAELRVMAYYSGDEKMVEIFQAGRKIHSEIAAELYGKNFDDAEYMKAKMISFGILYGRGAQSLSLQLGTTVREAQEYIYKFFELMPKVKGFLDEVHKQAVQTGELETLFGRRRRFGLVTHDNMHEVITQSNNYHCQSTASDLTLLALVEVCEQLPVSWGDPISFIHDSLMLEVVEGHAEEAAYMLKTIMETTPTKYLGERVPFVAETAVGSRWGELH